MAVLTAQPPVLTTTDTTPMGIALFGATGRNGGLLLEQALEAGHAVTAIVRNPERLPSPAPPDLRVVVADVMDPAAIAPALAGADAVILAIGPPGRAPSTVMTASACSIIAAMREVGVRRLIAISGSMVDDTGDGPVMRYLGKPITRRIFRGACEDMRRAEDEIHESGLVWTIMRPPRLTDKPATGRYRRAIDRNLGRAFTVSRADLAACTLAIVNDATTEQRHVFVAS
jgi:putative NADH-flavin reductase